MPQEDVGQKLLRGQRRQTWAMAVCFAALAALCLYVLVQNAHIHTALCTFQGELVATNQQSRAFLKTYPHGIAGITAASIQVGIDNRQRTIDSLSSLHCSSA